MLLMYAICAYMQETINTFATYLDVQLGHYNDPFMILIPLKPYISHAHIIHLHKSIYIQYHINTYA